jgi:hypothetical protein
MSARLATATTMAIRDQRRRPLVLILLVFFPTYVISKAIADTRATPRVFELPGGGWATTTMRALHGPEMAKISVAFVAALVGVFVMQSALQGDRRLVLAGFPARTAVLGRLLVLVGATLAVVTVSAAVTALFFTPAQWPVAIVGLFLIGLIYAAIGALAGAVLNKLAATYSILFLAMTDLGVVQTPMFHAQPTDFAYLLPGYAPTRVMLDGAFSDSFHAGGELALAFGWLLVLATVVYVVLRRAVATDRRIAEGADASGH